MWGHDTLNTTAGDLLHLVAAQPVLSLDHPLLLASGVTLAGSVSPDKADAGTNNQVTKSGRHLLQQDRWLMLQCSGKNKHGSAIVVR
jgi:hypothetical protein